MAYRFRYVIDIEMERERGKFAPREELAEEIQRSLDEANFNDLDCANEGHYNVTSWEVNEQEPPKPQRRARRKADPQLHED